MSQVTYNPDTILPAGKAATYNSSLSTSNTYLVPNDGNVLLHFKKTGAGACTVTIQTNIHQDGLALPNETVTVPATTGDVFVGPFPPHIFNQNGNVQFTLSEITGLSVAAIHLG